jgi:alpha-ketoglutarate-dependent taurine dioxygenase
MMEIDYLSLLVRQVVLFVMNLVPPSILSLELILYSPPTKVSNSKVTGKKTLFVSPNFGSHIVGFKKEESDNLLNFLNLHIGLGVDFQARARWEPGTIVVFDNRSVLQYILL